jgi:hypothetical protein
MGPAAAATTETGPLVDQMPHLDGRSNCWLPATSSLLKCSSARLWVRQLSTL